MCESALCEKISTLEDRCRDLELKLNLLAQDAGVDFQSQPRYQVVKVSKEQSQSTTVPSVY